jgi:hypothetical protein
MYNCFVYDRIITYSKDNQVEVDAFEVDSLMNGYGAKSTSEPIEIQDSIYYMPNYSDKPEEMLKLDEGEIPSLTLSTVFENDAIIVRASITYISKDCTDLNTPEEYKNYFLKDSSKEFILLMEWQSCSCKIILDNYCLKIYNHLACRFLHAMYFLCAFC